MSPTLRFITAKATRLVSRHWGSRPEEFELIQYGLLTGTQQPEGLVYPPFDPTVVGSVFISLVSDTPFLTTYNRECQQSR